MIDLEAVALEHAADDVGALFRLVAAPAAPDDERFAHGLLLLLSLRSAQSSSPTRQRRRQRRRPLAGGSMIATARPRRTSVWNASITSST